MIELSPIGGAAAENVIYSFLGTEDGCGPSPVGRLVIDDKGVLYGATDNCGTIGGGTVFCLTPPGTNGAQRTEQTLYDFVPHATFGILPNARMVIGPGRVLYVSTKNGGDYGYGMVFSLTPPVPGPQPLFTPLAKAWTELCRMV